MSFIYDTVNETVRSLGSIWQEDDSAEIEATKGKQFDVSNDSEEATREEVLRRFYSGVDVRNRKYRMKKYKRCFIGSEAVNFMVESGWATSRLDAVQLGLSMQEKFNLFEHVTNPEKKKFADEYLFFRFVDQKQADVSSLTRDEDTDLDSGFVATEVSQKSLDVSRCQNTYISGDKGLRLGIISVGELLRTGVVQKYNMALDKEGFYANEAIDYFVSTGLAASRREAVSLGLALQQAAGMIVNVKSKDDFCDTKLFFVFADERAKTWNDELEQAKKFFLQNIKTRDHYFRLKVYKNTFTGAEAVDLLLLAGVTNTRKDAVLLGRALAVVYKLFGHVADEHEFEDSELFYKFFMKR